jgi:hypothetical protein
MEVLTVIEQNRRTRKLSIGGELDDREGADNSAVRRQPANHPSSDSRRVADMSPPELRAMADVRERQQVEDQDVGIYRPSPFDPIANVAQPRVEFSRTKDANGRRHYRVTVRARSISTETLSVFERDLIAPWIMWLDEYLSLDDEEKGKYRNKFKNFWKAEKRQ